MVDATPQKPTYRADVDMLLDLPDHIKSHPYFCLWRWDYDKKRGAWTKVPYDPNRPSRKAKPNDTSTYSTFDKTLDVYAEGNHDGVGVGLFDGLSGVDIDHHLDDDGYLDEFAQGVVDTMGAYTEVSPSGDGVHILFTC